MTTIRQPRSQDSTQLRPASPLFGLIVFAAWIAAEIMAFNLVASWTGGSLAFFLFIMKTVLGTLFVTRVIRQKLFSLLKRGGGGIVLDGTKATETWLKGLGAFLIIIPGFLAGVFGLALLTPSVRRWFVRRSGARAQNPREIDLSAQDWKEVPDASAKRIRRRKTTEAE
jgi:UPF0716 family protein affecting phage T7 exclusion